MKVEVKGDNLIVTMPIDKDLPKSKSGKSRLLCTTGGNQKTTLEYAGEVVILGLTAYIKAEE